MSTAPLVEAEWRPGRVRWTRRLRGGGVASIVALAVLTVIAGLAIFGAAAFLAILAVAVRQGILLIGHFQQRV